MYVCSEYDRKEKRKKDDGSESFPVLVLFFFRFLYVLLSFKDLLRSCAIEAFRHAGQGIELLQTTPPSPHIPMPRLFIR